MLYCKKLDENAVLPTVSHPGEDLGYDVYALETVILEPYFLTKLRTGIAARFVDDTLNKDSALVMSEKINFGLLLRDRSSMAGKGIVISGGVIDAGFTGEILVMLTNRSSDQIVICAGDKIAQMIPLPVKTENGVIEVSELPESKRKEKGFGSSGI